jgi:hypothetical protein
LAVPRLALSSRSRRGYFHPLPRLPYNGDCSSLFSSPPRSPLPPALHSRCGCLVLPRSAVRGGSGVVDGPREARVGCTSSVSPTHRWWSSSSSSSSRRASGAAGGCVCLPRPGPVVDVASSSPSHRLLPPPQAADFFLLFIPKVR